jgi:signal transduction histidine kinase
VEADAREISRALSNLVVNAIRHTPAHGMVTITAESRDGSAVLTVTDQCGGIPADHLLRLFEPGWRGSSARSPGDGAGLGLAVVKGVMAAQGGRVEVQNVPGGCRFELVLDSP